MNPYTYNRRKNICGSKVRIARLAKKLTQTDLAIMLRKKGITLDPTSISRIEAGARLVTDFELKKLSEVLGVSMTWFLDEGTESFPKRL